MTLTILQAWFALCIIMAIRDTSEDAYDEDYHMQHMAKRFCINLLMWHYWFVIDCLALWNARRGDRCR